jgi:SNF2 family DNA or RNA helicase
MGDTQRRLYQDLAKELIARLGDEELTVKNAAVLDLRLGQITGGFFPFDEGSPAIKMIGEKNPKVERVKELLEEIEGQVIIWARFVAEIEILLSELRRAYPDKEIAGYYGAIPEKTREATKKAFQDGQIDYLVMNPQVGGMGLNFQNCATSIYFSRSYNLEERLQSEARIHRFGQSKPVQYIDLICPGTVEEKIVRALHAKKDLLEFIREKKIKEIVCL